MLPPFQVEIHVDLYSGPAAFLGESPSAFAWLKSCCPAGGTSGAADPVMPRAALVASCSGGGTPPGDPLLGALSPSLRCVLTPYHSLLAE